MNELAKVRRARERATTARSAFEQAIRDAHAAGESTRSIGKAAGLSHQRVWQIVKG